MKKLASALNVLAFLVTMTFGFSSCQQQNQPERPKSDETTQTDETTKEEETDVSEDTTVETKNPQEGMSEELKCITGAVWVSGTSNHTYFIFSKNGHCRISYVNRNGYQEWEEKGNWSFDAQSKKLITTISNYSWEMNIISANSMQGTKFGGGSTGFSANKEFSNWRCEMIDPTWLQGAWEYDYNQTKDKYYTFAEDNNIKIEIGGAKLKLSKEDAVVYEGRYRLSIKDSVMHASGSFFQYDDFLDIYRPSVTEGDVKHYFFTLDLLDSSDVLKITYLSFNNLKINDKNEKYIGIYNRKDK